VTDDEIRAELQALLQEGGSGEAEWADGTPEGEELWRLTHPRTTIEVETTYLDYRAQRVVARSESRVQRMPPVEASL
jgi:hypothetical protein